MKTTTQYENLSSTDRVIRSVVSVAAVVGAMETSLVGTPAFTAVSVVAIALATTAIIGWDPVKALLKSATRALTHQGVSHSGHHA